MEERYTDIHCHILCGIDDGPKDEGEMLDMLRRAAQDGVGRIVASSHIEPGLRDFPYEAYDRALDRARELCRREGFPLEILPGAEVLFTGMTPFYLRDGKVPTLNGTAFILVEFLPDTRYAALKKGLKAVTDAGYIPVLAHAERIGCLRLFPARLKALRRDVDIRIQLNCAAVLCERGFFLRRFVRHVLREKLVDAVASDAHNTVSRPTRMREAAHRLYTLCDEAYAHRLICPDLSDPTRKISM